MAVVIPSKLVEYWFTPADQKGKKNKAQYLLKPLTPYEENRAKVDAQLNDDYTIRDLHPDGAQFAVEAGLKDWKNVKDESGNDVKFEPGMIDLMDATHYANIMVELITGSKLNEEAVKK